MLKLKQSSKIKNRKAPLLIETSRVYSDKNEEYFGIGVVTVTCAIRNKLNKKKVKTHVSGKTPITIAPITRRTVCSARSKLGSKANRTIVRSKLLKLTL